MSSTGASATAGGTAGGGYDPHAVEPEIRSLWEAGGYFHADADPARKPFVIVIPPPNVTGALHLGHALNNTLQDILIRVHRMRGYVACWVPGTDHAGIATQAVVEKRLQQEEKKSRHELGRAGLVEKIWAWKEEYNARIVQQLERMGCSCDWRRTRFTLDEVCARAVYDTFFRMFRDGLIYRGKRLVNWDTQLQTAVADDEVYHETVKGSLWHVRYPILPGTGSIGVPPVQTEGEIAEAMKRAASPDARLGVDYLVVATTRPETMLADTAVAVHPDDERWRGLIGVRVVLPLTGRSIPVIGDPILVKREFGTGCVKVTPGHDPNDYACWQRMQKGESAIEIRNMMTPDGRIAKEEGGTYGGLKLEEGRKRVVADLEAAGLLEKVEPYETDIGHSDRSKTPIQPFLSEQWFVKMERLAELAMDAVRDGRVRFFPERFAKSYLDWLGEKRDWCISRQLWWGHRIPVWTKRVEGFEFGEFFEYPIGDTRRIEWATLSVGGEDLPVQERREGTGRLGTLSSHVCIRPDNERQRNGLEVHGFVQDPDVLDTWFSSALWPHSVFGWNADAGAADANHSASAAQSGANDRTGGTPMLRKSDLDYFYPTAVLSTARDIISLWVARMVMTGLYNTGRVPFQHVLIHPTIQDGQGRRMSKSLGNGVDPMDLIDLYGADAMRFVLASIAGETQDARIPVKPIKLPDGRTVNGSERFELGRNFCNKIWQAATGLVLPNLAGYAPRPLEHDELAMEDRWILSRLAACIDACDQRLANYQFNEFTGLLYSFFWSDLCDWYLELIKPRLRGGADAGAANASGDTASPSSSQRGSPDGAVARQVLAFVLDQALRLLHPVMPFVTEAIWQRLNAAAPRRGVSSLQDAKQEPALIAAAWPSDVGLEHDEAIERELADLQDVIRALREIRTHVNAIRSASKQPAIRTLPGAAVRTDAERAAKLRGREAVIQRMGQCEALEFGPQVAKPPESAAKVLSGIEVFVSLTGLADLEVERQRLRKERDELAAHAERVAAKLATESFVSRAPAAVVEQERERLADLRTRLAAIDQNLAEIGG